MVARQGSPFQTYCTLPCCPLPACAHRCSVPGHTWGLTPLCGVLTGPRALPLGTNLLSVVTKGWVCSTLQSSAVPRLCHPREHSQFDPSSSSPAGEEVCLQAGIWRSELLFKLGMRSELPSISCISSILQDPTGKMSLSGSGKGLTQL